MIASALDRSKPDRSWHPHAVGIHPHTVGQPLSGTLHLDRLLYDDGRYIVIGRVGEHRMIVRVPPSAMTTFPATARYLIRQGIILDGWDARWPGPHPAMSHGDPWIETLAAAARGDADAETAGEWGAAA